MSFYSELKRRNVFKVAIVYVAVAWLLLQVSDTLGPALHLPEWFVSGVAFLVILGFPVAIVIAWAFELTPEGLRKETSAEPAETGPKETSNKLNLVMLAALVIALSYFAADKFVLDADRAPDVDEPSELDNTIAVLPFVNMSSDKEQEYFSDGLSEELLNLLAQIPELNVAARTSSFSFKDKDLELPEIASRLNVANVLEGSVRKQDNQIRVTAQLIRADTGYHLWSETYDRQLANVFQIQEEIAVAVVDALKITLLGEAPTTRQTDPEAYQLFLEGQYLKRQLSNKSLHQAVEAFEKAVEIDPEYVPAWAELADTYIWGGGSDKYSPQVRQARADGAIDMAIRTDPDYAFAYYVRGISDIFVHNSLEQGIRDFEHALELDPDNAFIVASIGKGAVLSGKFDLAISQYQKALAMEPVVPEFYWFMGLAYVNSGRFDEAEATFRKLSTLTWSLRGRYHLWMTLFLKGELDAAMAEADFNFSRGITHHALGNKAEADESLAELIENSGPYRVAMAYGYRGEADKTFEWLNKLMEDESGFPTFILAEPAFQSVYSDPRWELFLEELGLLEYWRERP